MKKTALAIVPLLLGAAIGFFICKEYFCEKPTNCPECPPTSTTEAPAGIISTNQAIALHETYVGEHYTAINNAMGDDFLDTQFVWFEYDRIKQYLQYLEAVQNKNPSNPPISGVRVYFGAHDANNGQYPNQQTVFFTPTIDTKLSEKHSNMKNLPFYIKPKRTSDPLVGKYKIIGRLLIDQYNPEERAFMANSNLGNKDETRETMVQKSGDAKNGDDGTSLSFNLGHLSPPPPRG
ncbi:hypothetical protein EZY14_016955 [Kordia sp. TARA_039_SRF]|nr:hypothetical protein EZY14_016955 [Kordia sp. TARA_039_SRF]